MNTHESVQERFIALRRAMVADGATWGVSFLEKDLSFIYESICREGTGFIYDTLPTLGRAVDQGLVTGRFSSPSNLRLKGKTKLPLFMYSVLTDIFHDDGVLRDSPNIVSIRFARQFLLFDGKVERPPTKEQEERAIQGFKDRQRALRKVRVDTSDPVIRLATGYLTQVLKDHLLDDIVPGHGPGAVAEGLKRDTRWDWKSWPRLAERFYPFVPYGVPSPSYALGMGNGVKLVNPVTRCVLVPKDFRGPRLISAESASTQFLQQGQMKALMHYVDHHPITRNSISFRDQSRNQERAFWACDGTSVTLDLSDASDTVSTVLVWHLLSGVPNLRRRLMATRSSFMRMPDGTLEKIVAFAPMGSAVCFPVETLVFWSLAMGSLALTRLTKPYRRGASLSSMVSGSAKELSSYIGVFGDDIIIPADAFKQLEHTLLSVGCRPNMSKTCYATPFRESCGAEWFKFSDVTVIRNRKILYENYDKSSNHTSMLELQRRFYVRGFSHVAEHFQDQARKTGMVHVKRVVGLQDLERVSYDGQLLIRDMRGSGIPSSGISTTQLHLLRQLRDRKRQVPCVHLREDSPEGLFPLCKLCEGRYPLDTLLCAFGYDNELDVRYPVRWNRALCRLEVQHRLHIQKCRPWAASDYARLSARINGDYIDRIPLRGLRQIRGWRNST